MDVSAWASGGPEGMLGGFTVPVAITWALWHEIDIDDDREHPACDGGRWRALARHRGESTRGRAHDVIWMLRVAVHGAQESDRLSYGVLMTVENTRGGLVRRGSRSRRGSTATGSPSASRRTSEAGDGPDIPRRHVRRRL